MIRTGTVLSAPHFVTENGPGTKIDNSLVAKWKGFPIEEELSKRFSKPTKVANDADLQGAAVVRGIGFELVLTLGTGLGSALFFEGELLPHMEFAHIPFRKGETYNEQLGDAVRKEIGDDLWIKRVHKAIEVMRILTFFDRLYVGGGNSKRLGDDLPDDVEVVDNSAGILGGIRLWEPTKRNRAV